MRRIIPICCFKIGILLNIVKMFFYPAEYTDLQHSVNQMQKNICVFFAESNDISYVKQKQQSDNGCEFSDGVVTCSFVPCPYPCGRGTFLCISVFFYKVFLTFLQIKKSKKRYISLVLYNVVVYNYFYYKM